MDHYSYTKNTFHKCDGEGCSNKSFYQVYPSGQPAGIMHGSTMMCKKHFKIFEKRYWEGVDVFFNAVMNGEEYTLKMKANLSGGKVDEFLKEQTNDLPNGLFNQ